ncbi:MAG: ATPase, T2SS/T4P/T4SS family [Phycisphaerales bacterium JB064]
MPAQAPTFILRPMGWQGRAHPLDGREITIGRHPSNTVRLADEKASRHHCAIRPDATGRYMVVDMDSRNGTRVNEVKVQQTYIDEGDVIRVGGHEFLVEVPTANANSEDAEGDPGDSATATVTRTTRKKKEAGTSAANATWAKEIRRTIESLPPAGKLIDDITILNASGQRTGALAGQSPGPVAVRLLLSSADKSRATDIHVEPRGDTYNARLRVDGQMVPLAELPASVGTLACNLIKTACELEVAGKQAIHDGTMSALFTVDEADRRVEYRVSFTPAVGGQKLVMRVLDGRGVPHSVDDLGLAPYMLPRIKRVLSKDQGMLLVCGPTGSGKTTTLHNCVREIDRERKNVVTIEDPVEYKLEGVTQIPVDDKQGLGFHGLLRSVLRQDPDVILVGEVRDEETARTAMQAAMTGHLVFSTVHAKDTVAAVFRVLDLGVEPYLVANALDLILAQRLVRVLCTNCRRDVPLSPGEASKLGATLSKHSGASNKANHVFTPTGCARCLRTGYIGRRAIFELLEFNDALRDIVLQEPSIQAMKRVIEADLFTTLRTFGLRLAAQGITSLEEVNQVAGGE